MADVRKIFEQLDQLRNIKEKIRELEAARDAIRPVHVDTEESSRIATAIIVEPRKHRALEFVIKNVLDNLPANWNIQIHHGTRNQQFVEEIVRQLPSNRITLKNLGVENVPFQEFQILLTSREFTEAIPTETFIVFHTDSMINPNQKHLLNKFLEYDYVGAPWPNGQVGNGGFSLRKRSKMLEIIAAAPPRPNEHEDTYFSSGARGKVKLHKPDFIKAMEFSIETVPSPIFFALHKVWAWHPDKMLDFCIRCPGLNDLIKLQGVYPDDPPII